MSKYAKLYQTAVIFPLAFLLLSFANTRTFQTTSPDIKVADRFSNIDGFNAHPAAIADVTNNAAKLHFFIGKREDFEDLPPPTKLIFSHTFDGLGPANLNAWFLDENDKFEEGKKIILVSGGLSGEDIKPGLVFGNVVLKPGALAKIKRELRRDKDALYVIFKPVIVDEFFIGYSIGISDTKGIGANFAEFAEANPSPPRVY